MVVDGPDSGTNDPNAVSGIPSSDDLGFGLNGDDYKSELAAVNFIHGFDVYR